MTGLISWNVNLQNDIGNYYLSKMLGSDAIFNAYVDAAYDSSADYRKLNRILCLAPLRYQFLTLKRLCRKPKFLRGGYQSGQIRTHSVGFTEFPYFLDALHRTCNARRPSQDSRLHRFAGGIA
jgi:hypothetical protein